MTNHEATFGMLRCCDCECEWPAEIPPLYEDMPACAYCESGPVQLVELLRLERDELLH